MPVRLGGALVAEFVGTFALTFVGMLAIFHSAEHGGLMLVAFAHGLILAVMVSAAIHTSGGHFNPAVTFGFLVTRKIDPVSALAYIVIQLLGGIIAALLVYVVLGAGDLAAKAVADGTPQWDAVVHGPWVATGVEIVATFFLVFVIWGSVADPRARNVGGFAIGLTIAADILAFGPITGASMNPARSFGPTLISSMLGFDFWDQNWVYWVGPGLGGLIAALVYYFALWPRTERAEPGAVTVPPTQRP